MSELFKGDNYKDITNIRTDSLGTKLSFVNHPNKKYKLNPVIIVVEGFYEWKQENNIKLPHLITNKHFNSDKAESANIMLIAGIE